MWHLKHNNSSTTWHAQWHILKLHKHDNSQNSINNTLHKTFSVLPWSGWASALHCGKSHIQHNFMANRNYLRLIHLIGTSVIIAFMIWFGFFNNQILSHWRNLNKVAILGNSYVFLWDQVGIWLSYEHSHFSICLSSIECQNKWDKTTKPLIGENFVIVQIKPYCTL